MAFQILVNRKSVLSCLKYSGLETAGASDNKAAPV